MLGDTAKARDASAEQGRYARRLGFGFGALVAFTFGLIVLGALVRAHGAGLACPDWPLCFGELVPRMDLRVGFEWTHRLVAGSVALGFSALAVAALRRPDTRRATRVALAVAAALLAVQVLLGALTVWLRLSPWTVTAHLVTGNAFAATLLGVASALHEHAGGRPRRAQATRGARVAVGAAAALLALQLVLGGLVSSRYAGLACPEWPTCREGLWFPSWSGSVGLHLLHRMNGYALLLALGAAALACRRAPALRAVTRLTLVLGLAQVGVGVASVRLGIPVEVTGLHSALAAALVLALTLAVREAWPRAT